MKVINTVKKVVDKTPGLAKTVGGALNKAATDSATAVANLGKAVKTKIGNVGETLTNKIFGTAQSVTKNGQSGTTQIVKTTANTADDTIQGVDEGVDAFLFGASQ